MEEHTRERKRRWYEETNYRDKLRIDKRIQRNSVRVFTSKYDKMLDRDFSEVLNIPDLIHS
jgi:hypothetical protein